MFIERPFVRGRIQACRVFFYARPMSIRNHWLRLLRVLAMFLPFPPDNDACHTNKISFIHNKIGFNGSKKKGFNGSLYSFGLFIKIV